MALPTVAPVSYPDGYPSQPAATKPNLYFTVPYIVPSRIQFLSG